MSATNQLLGLPTGVAVGSAGRILVANNTGGTVVQIDPETAQQVVLSSGGCLGGPFGIAVVRKLELRAPTLLPDGSFKFFVFGEPGQAYLLEYSTNFNTWFAAGTVTNVTGLSEFIDPIVPGHPCRFYRVRSK